MAEAAVKAVNMSDSHASENEIQNGDDNSKKTEKSSHSGKKKRSSTNSKKSSTTTVATASSSKSKPDETNVEERLQSFEETLQKRLDKKFDDFLQALRNTKDTGGSATQRPNSVNQESGPTGVRRPGRPLIPLESNLDEELVYEDLCL